MVEREEDEVMGAEWEDGEKEMEVRDAAATEDLVMGARVEEREVSKVGMVAHRDLEEMVEERGKRVAREENMVEEMGQEASKATVEEMGQEESKAMVEVEEKDEKEMGVGDLA